MFKVQNNKIAITRGDTGIFRLDIQDTQGNNYNYENDTVVFTVKENTKTTETLIKKTISPLSDVVIEPGDTKDLDYGDYVYDVQLTTTEGVVDTVIAPSVFRVLPEVTFDG